MALAGQTKHFRLAAAAVTILANAITPLYLDFYVTFDHPCSAAVFSDSVFNPGTIVATAYSPIHPLPTVLNVADFPHNIRPDISCGPQTMTLVAVSVITPGLISDFVSIAKVVSQWQLTVAPTNTAQVNNIYELKLQVSLDNYTGVTYTSSTSFFVDIKQSCSSGTVTGFTWSPSGSSALSQQTVFLNNAALILVFTASSSLAHCSL